MRALLAQLEPLPGSPAANASRAAEMIRDQEDCAALVVFPELYLSGYDLAAVGETAIEPDGPVLGGIRRAAAESGTAVAIGFAEQRGSALANSLALIDEHGTLSSVYRKVQLFGDEAEVFEAGDELVVWEAAGRRIGPLICFDIEFPEPARALARAGADMLVTAAANMEPYFEDHVVASRARALDNRVPHLYVNRCGEEAGVRFVGGTRAVRSDGTVSAAAGQQAEQTLDVRVEDAGSTDERVEYLTHVREDLKVIAPTSTRGGST